MQRTGTRSDLLKGPVVYGVVHGLAAILFWKSSPVGIVVLAFLCAGDGLAEIVGTRIGSSNPLPHNPKKVRLCIPLLSFHPAGGLQVFDLRTLQVEGLLGAGPYKVAAWPLPAASHHLNAHYNPNTNARSIGKLHM